jgi:hypothetical protein
MAGFRCRPGAAGAATCTHAAAAFRDGGAGVGHVQDALLPPLLRVRLQHARLRSVRAQSTNQVRWAAPTSARTQVHSAVPSNSARPASSTVLPLTALFAPLAPQTRCRRRRHRRRKMAWGARAPGCVAHGASVCRATATRTKTATRASDRCATTVMRLTCSSDSKLQTSRERGRSQSRRTTGRSNARTSGGL